MKYAYSDFVYSSFLPISKENARASDWAGLVAIHDELLEASSWHLLRGTIGEKHFEHPRFRRFPLQFLHARATVRYFSHFMFTHLRSKLKSYLVISTLTTPGKTAFFFLRFGLKSSMIFAKSKYETRICAREWVVDSDIT